MQLYRDRPNVAVLRTFSKAHGLAGLRVGYALGLKPTDDSVPLFVYSDPFPINGGRTYFWKFRVWSDVAIPQGITMTIATKTSDTKGTVFFMCMSLKL